MTANDRADLAQMVGEAGQLLAEHRMLLHNGHLGRREGYGGFFPALDELARHAHESDVVEPRGDFERLALLGRQVQSLGHRAAQLKDASRLRAERRVKRLHRAQAKLDRALEVFVEGVVELFELLVLLGDAGDLLFQREVHLRELLVHRHGGDLEHLVLADEIVALHRVLHGDEQFLAEPRLDDETVDFPLVDRVDDGGEIQHRRDEDARGVGLEQLHLREEFQTGEHRHLLVADHDGEGLLLEQLERVERVGRGGDLVAFARERVAQGDEHDFLVIDQEDVVELVVGVFHEDFPELGAAGVRPRLRLSISVSDSLKSACGSQSAIFVPAFSCESTATAPRCFSAKSRAL